MKARTAALLLTVSLCACLASGLTAWGAEPQSEGLLAGAINETLAEEGLLAPGLATQAGGAHALEVSAGECGDTASDKVYWMLDASGETLTIFGSGAMKELTLDQMRAARNAETPADADDAPWLAISVRDQIRTVNISAGVTSIGSNSFRYLAGVTKITIADTVQTIGDSAFQGMTSLASLELPDSVIDLGESVCSGCTSLKDLTLSQNLSSLPNMGFYKCSSLEKVVIPAKTTILGMQTFLSCSGLKELRCMGNVTSVGTACLTNAGEDSGGFTIYANPNGRVKDYYIENRNSPYFHMTFCAGDLNDAVISLSNEHYVYSGSACTPTVSVTLYGNLNLSSSTDYTVTYLNNNSAGTATVRVQAKASGDFVGSQDVTFTIAASGYGGTTGQVYWELLNGVLRIYGNGYMYDDYDMYKAPWDDHLDEVRSIVIEEGVKSIATSAFSSINKQARYTSVFIPTTVALIGKRAFEDNQNLQEVVFAPRGGSQELHIEQHAFFDDISIRNLVLPEGLTVLDIYAFGCSNVLPKIETLVLPKTYTDSALSGKLPGYAKKVYGYPNTPAESYYKGEPNVDFIYRTLDSDHASVSLYPYEFAENGKAQRPQVYVYARSARSGLTQLQNGTDYTVTYLDCIHEGTGTVVVEGKGLYSGTLQVDYAILGSEHCCGDDLVWTLSEDGELKISGKGDMWDFESADAAPWASRAAEIKKIWITSEVTSIGSYAFASLPNLNFVRNEANLTKIGEKAFFDTPSLTSLIVPTSVTQIGEKAIGYAADGSVVPGFDCCTDSPIGQAYAAANGLDLEDPQYFKEGKCGSYVGWKLRDNGTRLILYAYGTEDDHPRVYDYSKTGAPWHSYAGVIEAVEVGEGVEVLGTNAFADLAQVKQVKLPSSLKKIYNSAFDGMSALTELAIPDSVTMLSTPFWNMSSLVNLKLPKSLEDLRTNTIYNCSKLASLVIPESVQKIEENAIRACPALEWIYIPRMTFSIEAGAIKDLMKLTVYGEEGTAAQQFARAPLGPGDTLQFDFVDVDLAHSSATLSHDNYIFDGKAKTPDVTVTASGQILQAGRDFTVSYKNNADIGTASVVVTGKGLFKGTKTVPFKIVMSDKVIAEPAVDRFIYDGKAKTPGVTVTDNGHVIAPSLYKASYLNNKNVGTAQIVVRLKAPYSIIVKCTFTIAPKGTKLKSLKPQKKKVKVIWKKQAKQTTGYQIKYSQKKNFSASKIVTVKGPKKKSCIIKGLKSGKKCYVRVRTYKVVGGKKYTSAWSAKKVVKVK